MSSYKEIGGYFGLEFESFADNIGSHVALNSGRSCLRYIVRAYNIKEIYVPYYTCPVVWQTLQKEKCKINFYHIDNEFLPCTDFDENDYILYTNYFGVCAKNVKKMSNKYKNLIVDNSQAFYMPQYGLAAFNSIRKFFGVSDGALLSCKRVLEENFEQDTSWQRFSYLLKRIDISAQFGYNDFCTNEINLQNEPIKLMSNLTRKIFNSLDLDRARLKRIENYKYLDSELKTTNMLKLVLDEDDVPMIYPYMIKNDSLRSYLAKNKVYVATYWNSLPKNSKEGELQRYLLPIPVDQRYLIEDMKYIVELIKGV